MIKTALISFVIGSINTRLLASYIKKTGYETICIFCQGNFNKNKIDVLIEFLKNQNIHFAGISLVTDDYHSAVLLTEEIRKKLKIPIIWGGTHVNVRPDECLQHADMVCMGEGEEALLELVKNISKQGTFNTGIQNIWFNLDGKIIKNEIRNLEDDLDQYPFPDFDLNSQYVLTERGIEKFEGKHLNGVYGIMTSRGCPYSCCYCYNSYRKKHYSGKGRYLRTRSITNVIEELAEARRVFKDLLKINFWDDSFIARPIGEFETFSSLYVERVNLPFFALIEPMAFEQKKIKLLKDAGLCELQVGIQSGSVRVNREIYKRCVSNEKIYAMAESIHALALRVTYDIIFNNPYETKSDMRETIDMLLRFPRPLFLQGYSLIFYPQTEIAEMALRDGYISQNPEIDTFSTIQSTRNGPFSTKGKAEISGRFYTINYDSCDKIYSNSVISILGFRFVPRQIALFFVPGNAF